MKIFGMDTGKRMTKEQLTELDRLRTQVKNGDLSVNEARDVWNSKFDRTEVKTKKEEKTIFDKVFTDYLANIEKSGTRSTYRSYLTLWIEYTKMNGAESLAFKKEDKDALTEKLVLGFHSWIRKGKAKGGLGRADNSAKTGSGVIRGFYSAHRLPLVFISGEKKTLKGVNRTTEDYLFSREDLAKMCQNANLTEKYIVLIGKSIGFRVGDFQKLTFGKFRALDLTQEPPIFLSETPTTKESVPAFPFLDSDSVPIVKEILAKNTDKKDSDRVLVYNEKSFSQVLQRLFKNASLVSGSKIVRFHALRQYLIDRLSAVCSESQWKQIVGKKISESAYVSHIQLQGIWARAQKDIICMNGNGKTKAQVEALESALAMAESERLDMKTRLDQALKQLEAHEGTFKEHEGTFKRMNTRLETLEEIERKKPHKIERMD